MSHHHHHQQRVVADGWGRQASGSVFCADSSLRYIFESPAQPPAPGTTAAAITSLASGEFDHGLKSKSTTTSTTMYPPTTPSYDKLTSSSAAFMSANMAAAKLHPHGHGVVHTTNADGVDLFEAQIAKACAQITKQVASLPHSFRECSVCLTQNAYAQIHVCGHTFHSKCFLRWFRMNRSCPLCRGPVDAIQVAPVLSVQDELEAIMAEMDDEDDHTPLAEGVDPLMANPDLISFLGEGFDDADMEMMALDELTAGADKMAADPIHNDDDVSMDDDDEDDCGHHHHPHHQHHHQHHQAPPVMTPTQYAPTSTMPNYWNVLNQGLTMPSVMPVQPPTHHHHHQTTQQSLQQQQRVVPIAPKPDGQFHVPTHAHPTMFGQFPTPRATSPVATHVTAPVASPTAPRVVSCRCTGGCRNGRCACVKEGGMCGAACRCTSCKNPFLMVKAAGADIDALLQDACFMHNVSKTRDMVQRMQEPVEVPCCGTTLTVLDCVQGYLCTQCDRTFDFSWCMNKLLDHDKTPRNHCEICKRCCDHRDVHCNDCGRCYFAGVAASLPCPCKESSRKRRDHSQQQPGSNNTDAVKEEATGGDGEEDKDGECTIM